MNYEKMYHLLFNAITDALAQIENQNYGKTLAAQKTCSPPLSRKPKKSTWNPPTNPWRAQQCCLGRQKQVCTNLK